MGRLLGAHDSDELDRPDLNKCPDCGCFFPQDNCPLCGKECPEEYRAGNRKAVKPKKKRSSSGRVTFVEWYHSWWFIIIMMFFMPVIGIILLITSPHKKGAKIIFVILAIVYTLFTTFGISGIISRFTNALEEPVERLSYEEYTEKCKETDPEEFYRAPHKFDGEFVTMKLTVKQGVVDMVGYYDNVEYSTYYICTDGEGNEFEIMIRDCETDPENYIKGDVITVYGEGAGMLSLDDMDYVHHSAPCIYAAYIE